jgi:hypothetical protein
VGEDPELPSSNGRVDPELEVLDRAREAVVIAVRSDIPSERAIVISGCRTLGSSAGKGCRSEGSIRSARAPFGHLAHGPFLGFDVDRLVPSRRAAAGSLDQIIDVAERRVCEPSPKTVRVPRAAPGG